MLVNDEIRLARKSKKGILLLVDHRKRLNVIVSKLSNLIKDPLKVHNEELIRVYYELYMNN